MTARRPTPTQMDLAAEWLDVNQGDEEDDEDEGTSCRAVAAWLRAEAAKGRDRATMAEAVRRLAAERGVSPAEIRRVVRERSRR